MMPLTVGRITQLDKQRLIANKWWKLIMQNNNNMIPLDVLQELNRQDRKYVLKELTEKKDEEKMANDVIATPVQALPVEIMEAKPKTLMEVGHEIDYIERFIQQFLKDGTDFGLVPGTKKKSLFLPGAEKLCAAFSMTAKFEVLSEERDPFKKWDYEVSYWDDKKKERVTETRTATGYYRVQVRCELYRRGTDILMASEIAECDSTERGRETTPANTIIKMAQKRAYVGSTRHATFTSDRFTGDVEDYYQGATQQAQSNGVNPEPLRSMKSRYGSEDKPSKCNFCENSHIKEGDSVVQHPTMKKGDKNVWGAASCYAATFTNGDKKPPEKTSASTPSTDPARKEVLESICDLEEKLTEKDKAFKVPDARTAACGRVDIQNATDDALVFYMKLLQEKLAGKPG